MKRTLHLLLILATILISGCVTPYRPMSKVPGKSYVLDNLAHAVLDMIAQTESICALQGAAGVKRGAPELVRTTVATPKKNGTWTEKWVIQREGYQVEYTIPFVDTPAGPTEFCVSNRPKKL